MLESSKLSDVIITRPQLAVLIGDAVRSAHRRYLSTREPIPLFFNTADYLELARSVANGTSRSCPLHLPVIDSAIDSVATAVASDVLDLTGWQTQGLEDALAAALRKINEYAAPGGSSPMEPQPDSSELVQILRNTADNLVEVRHLLDAAWEVIIRYWSSDHWNYSVLSDDGPHPKPLPNPDQGVKEAFDSGLLRYRSSSPDSRSLNIPCHFGGVPWLVLRRECPDNMDGYWIAYTAYRDVAPRFNEVLRLVVQYSYASEMRRLFVDYWVRNRGNVCQRKDDTERAWGALNCVYPVPRPRFLNASEPDDPSTLTLTFAGQALRIAFSPFDSPLLQNSRLVLRSHTDAPWGSVDSAVLKSTFSDPVLAALNEEDLRKSKELADARRSSLRHLGHTLKNRIDTVQAFLDQHQEAGLASHAQMLRDLSMILQLNCFDSLDQLLGDDKRDRFLDYADTPTGALDLLAMLTGEWAELVSRKREYLDLSGRIDAFCRLEIRSTITKAEINYPLNDSDNRPCRLSEAAYRELFFELLLNVSRYGHVSLVPGQQQKGLPVVSVLCHVDVAAHDNRQLLTITNRASSKRLPRHLQSVTWSEWPADLRTKCDGPDMAVNVLRHLGLGDLLYRRLQGKDGSEWLSVGIELRGLDIG